MKLGTEIPYRHACPACNEVYQNWWKGFVERYALRTSGTGQELPAVQPRPDACSDCVDRVMAERFIAAAQTGEHSSP